MIQLRRSRPTGELREAFRTDLYRPPRLARPPDAASIRGKLMPTRRRLAALLVLVILWPSLDGSTARAQEPPATLSSASSIRRAPASSYVPGELIVRLRD